jgi:hypothetical protein
MTHIVRYALPLIVWMAGASFAGAASGQGVPEGKVHDVVAERIEAAFLAVAEMPPADLAPLPLAVKGDLPPGCLGPFLPTVQAECIDTAYEPGSDPRTVVEMRIGSTSILTRAFEGAGAAFMAETTSEAPTPEVR